MFYAIALAAHVVIAVLAVGVVGAIPLVARVRRAGPRELAQTEPLLSRLLRVTQVGFVGMVITGILIDVSAGGAFHRAGWFKASIAALIVVGAAHARARRALRDALDRRAEPADAFRRLERWGWVMCGAIGVITILMQVKPLP